jgi:hypothetical protein
VTRAEKRNEREVFPVNAMKAYRGELSYSFTHINCGARWRLLMNLILRSLYFGESIRGISYKRLDGF